MLQWILLLNKCSKHQRLQTHSQAICPPSLQPSLSHLWLQGPSLIPPGTTNQNHWISLNHWKRSCSEETSLDSARTNGCPFFSSLVRNTCLANTVRFVDLRVLKMQQVCFKTSLNISTQTLKLRRQGTSCPKSQDPWKNQFIYQSGMCKTTSTGSYPLLSPLLIKRFSEAAVNSWPYVAFPTWLAPKWPKNCRNTSSIRPAWEKSWAWTKFAAT